MIGGDDDFIPHHMCRLEAGGRFRASPPSIHKGSIHKVSQAPEGRGSGDSPHRTRESLPFSRAKAVFMLVVQENVSFRPLRAGS